MSKQWDNDGEVIGQIKRLMPGCFGIQDLEFIMHPFEEDRAKELRAYAALNKVPSAKLIEMAKAFLVERGCTAKHISEQMVDIQEFFGKKIR